MSSQAQFGPKTTLIFIAIFLAQPHQPDPVDDHRIGSPEYLMLSQVRARVLGKPDPVDDHCIG